MTTEQTVMADNLVPEKEALSFLAKIGVKTCRATLYNMRRNGDLGFYSRRRKIFYSPDALRRAFELQPHNIGANEYAT